MENLIENTDISLLEEIKSNNNELLTIDGIIKQRAEKGKYAHTEVLAPLYDILCVYYLYIKTDNEKYGIYAREKLNALIKDLNYLRYEFFINRDFGIELLSNIDLNDITYLKQRAMLLAALDFHNKNVVLDLPIKHTLFELASYISEEEKEFAKREEAAYSDALLCLFWALDKLWSDALSYHDNNEMNRLSEEKRKCRMLAYDLGHPLAALELSKAYKNPTDNEKCKSYLMGALGTIDGIRYLDSNKHNIYDFWAYKGLMEIRQEFYDAYVEKTEDFYLLSKCAKVACTEKYAEKISPLILNNDLSIILGEDLVYLKKSLYWWREKCGAAYKKIRDYLCEKGDKNAIYEKILDEIDEGINVEENLEKLYSFKEEEARTLYDYKKNKRWNTYYFGSKYSDTAYPTCYREYQKGRPKDVESFPGRSLSKWDLDDIKK